MTSLKDQFLAACEVAGHIKMNAENGHQYDRGRIHENARLRPLLLAAAEVVAAADFHMNKNPSGLSLLKLEESLDRLAAALGEG